MLCDIATCMYMYMYVIRVRGFDHLHGSGAGVLPTEAVSVIGPHDLVGGQCSSVQVLIKWNNLQLLKLLTKQHTVMTHACTHSVDLAGIL